MPNLVLRVLVDSFLPTCTFDLSLWCHFSILEVTLVFRSWIIDLHRLRPLFLRHIRRAGKLRIQRLLESLDKLRLLFFNVGLVCVANEVDVFALLARSFVVFRRQPRLFLLKAVEASAVFFSLGCWLVLRLFITDAFPVNAPEERVHFDLFDAVSAQSVISIAHEPL